MLSYDKSDANKLVFGFGIVILMSFFGGYSLCKVINATHKVETPKETVIELKDDFSNVGEYSFNLIPNDEKCTASHPYYANLIVRSEDFTKSKSITKCISMKQSKKLESFKVKEEVRNTMGIKIREGK